VGGLDAGPVARIAVVPLEAAAHPPPEPAQVTLELHALHGQEAPVPHLEVVDDLEANPGSGNESPAKQLPWGVIAAVAAFFNMSNRVASATDMRPNAVYHAQGR